MNKTKSERRQSKRERRVRNNHEEQTHEKKQRTISIKPITENQRKYVMLLRDPKVDIVLGVGPAGTGKTMLATQVAIEMLIHQKIEQIVVVRPAVGVDDEEHGFLPGDLHQKMDPWIKPIIKVFKREKLFNHYEIQRMREEEIINVSPIAYMRGETFENAVIILDEAQNTTPTQFKMVLTRIGHGSKVFVTGDVDQHDTKFKENGLADFLKLFRQSKKQEGFIRVVDFGQEDIMRHPTVSTVLDIYGKE